MSDKSDKSDKSDSSDKCACGNPSVHECVNCKQKICEENDCGQDTVDGYLCGSYTQGGCGRKYTTCDICNDDKAIHEGDLNFCNDCSNGMCDTCAEDNTCAICENIVCGDCVDDHDCANNDKED